MITWRGYKWENVLDFINKTDFPYSSIKFITYMNVEEEAAVGYALDRCSTLLSLRDKCESQEQFEHGCRFYMRHGIDMRMKKSELPISDGETEWTYFGAQKYPTFEDLCLAQGWDLGRVYSAMETFDLHYYDLYMCAKNLILCE